MVASSEVIRKEKAQLQMPRDDFPMRARNQLALRVNYRCSNPDCSATTSGPQLNPEASINIGVAAHITAASEGGPRFSTTLTSEERASVENGIWLCQNCAKLIDNDVTRFSEDLLREWKRTTEAAARTHIGKPLTESSPTKILDSIHGQLRRESNPRFGFSFLHPAYWDREDPINGDGNTYRHPSDPKIEVRAWGGYAVVSNDLYEWVDQELQWLEQEDGFILVSKVSSGRHLVDWSDASGKAIKSQEQVEGCRIVYNHESDGHKLTSMQTLIQYDDTQISVLCQAPTKSYKFYEELFLIISHGIRVLGANSAPDARRAFEKNSWTGNWPLVRWWSALKAKLTGKSS